MEKVKKLLLSSLCLLSLLPASGCKDKIVVNNAFVYLVHEDCLSFGDIKSYNDGNPVSIPTIQWQIVDVGDYSSEVIACPKEGFKFLRWSDGNTNPNRKDLSSNDNDGGPVVYYAFFEKNA